VLLLHDYQPADGERPAYLVMELLSGPSLRSFLDKNGTPFAEVGAIIGLRVAQALEAAHAQEIVHRDVKPENVMFDLHGGTTRVVLCDFGIARLAAEGHTMTATGAVIGSPVFMSPEQARGDTIDLRSDLFSLGSLLYVLATGVPPFVATQPLAIMNKIAKGDHPPPMAKNPRVPRWLERIIERCLRVDPAQRYSSASEVVAALGDGLRADGLGDLDAELNAYLRDPPAYNESFGARIVASTLAQMREAVAGKQRARALTAAARILAWEPEHAEANGVVDKFDGHLFSWPRRWWWLAAPIAVAAVAGGVVVFRRPVVVEKPIVVEAPRPSPVVEKPIATPIEATPIEPIHKPIEAIQKPIEKPIDKHKTPRLAAVVPSPVAAAPPPPVEKPPEPEKPGTLTVAITPWCDLTVDGEKRGRAPLTLQLPAGPHHVECRQPGGAGLSRDVTLSAGATEVLRDRLFAAARVFTHLAAEFAIDDGKPSSDPKEAQPGRHKITLYRSGKIADTRWVDIRPEGCRVVDTPELKCEKP
jgi:hypothetical protein